MILPWGELESLDRNNLDLAYAILSHDKHSLVEGLVAECWFDQFVDKVIEASAGAAHLLDVETAIVEAYEPARRSLAFVWARSKGPGLGRYLRALERVYEVILIEEKLNGFVGAKISGGRRASEPAALSSLLQELSSQYPKQFEVDQSVRDSTRHRQAFWGMISSYYKENLWSRVVMPRILMNFGIQPYFRAVWNLDRVLVWEDQIWLIEVKHKFPFESGATLKFGLNNGEAQMLQKLVRAGLRCMYSVLVKPTWSKEVGSMYLITAKEQTERAALIGVELTKDRLVRMMGGQTKTSAAHTSINGRSNQKYKSVGASEFLKLGTFSMPLAEIAKNSIAVLQGSALESVEDCWLRSLRTPEINVKCVDSRSS